MKVVAELYRSNLVPGLDFRNQMTMSRDTLGDSEKVDKQQCSQRRLQGAIERPNGIERRHKDVRMLATVLDCR